MTLRVVDIGPAAAVQDLGRPGYLAKGLSRGGAADQLALYEGAALLGHAPDCAALEMAAVGGRFVALAPTVIALTGAQMRAAIDDTPVQWNASHALREGAQLTLGPVVRGTFAYLHLAGGIAFDRVIGARGAHLNAGIGALVKPGDILPTHGGLGSAGMSIDPVDRLDGGVLHIVPSMQSARFTQDLRVRFADTEFTRNPSGNRQAVRLDHAGPGFMQDGNLSVVSEIVAPGDVQISGDGAPYILMAESQTTGGYPRIGTILPSDMPRAAQAPACATLRFTWVTLEEARRQEARARSQWSRLAVRPLLRDPRDIANLGAFNLISGVTDGG